MAMGRNGFAAHDDATAAPDVADLLADARAQFGFVPNLLRLMAESPAALRGYRVLSKIFHSCSLTEQERLLVELTASTENGCGYCGAAHAMQAAHAGLAPEDIAAVRAGGSPQEPRAAVLVGTVRALIRRQGALDEADVTRFLTAGFTREQLLDVVLGIAVKTISNYTNHLVDAPLDPAVRAVDTQIAG